MAEVQNITIKPVIIAINPKTISKYNSLLFDLSFRYFIIFMKPNTKKTIPAISDTVFRTPSGSFTKIAPIIMKTSDSNKLSHSAFFKV